MNILIYNWKDIRNPDVGGAEIILFELAKRLVRDGHGVTWFCRQYEGCVDEEMIDAIHIVRRGGKYSTYVAAWWYYHGLQEKPDVVIDVLNTIFWQTPLYAKRGSVIAYVNQLAREVLLYELNPLFGVIAYLLEKYQFITYKKTPFLCYANSTKEDLMDVGIPERNVRIFRLGMDHERYTPGEKYPAPLFICISRLVKMKRTDVCIEAMELVVRKHPEAQLAIIGFGYERGNLRKLRDALHLEENVFFVDENMLFFEKTEGDQKVKFMRQAWALLFPSVKEGWGMTVTECAACGTPAIVTDVSGLRDSVKRDETGIVISKNATAPELADAMVRMIEDAPLRKRLSENAMRWSKNFNWEQSYREFRSHIIPSSV